MFLSLRATGPLSFRERADLQLAYDGPIPANANAPQIFQSGYADMGAQALRGWLRIALDNLARETRALNHARRRLRVSRREGDNDISSQAARVQWCHEQLRAARAEARPLLAEISRRSLPLAAE